jgi:hypothetical protein
MRKKIFLYLLLFVTFLGFSQETKKPFYKPYKLGFLYNYGTNENFVFDDLDYDYSSNTFKTQLFYQLGSWKKLDFELIFQPQVQFLKHQLLNEWFVTPDQDNVQEKIAEFTQPKNMNLYGLEFAFTLKRQVLNKLFLQGGISLGFSYIDTRTERLAKGFTFIENFSLGFSCQASKKSFIYLGTNFGHVSNLNFQKPNDGYNTLGIDVGYSFLIN